MEIILIHFVFSDRIALIVCTYQCFLQELSYEIDRHHDAYMEFMEQCLDKQDLLAQVGQGLRIEEKHLIYLELMIMEQVADWEVGTGNNVEKILKGSLDLIISPSVKIQIIGGKVCLRCEGKTFE